MSIDFDQVEQWLCELPEVLSVNRRLASENECAFEPEKGCKAAWNITCTIDSQSHELVVVLTGSFPADMPKVYLRKPREYGLLNHVNYYGDICFFDRSVGAFFDTSRVRDILYSGIYSALEELKKSLDDTEKTSLLDEFEGAWRWMESKKTADCLTVPSKSPMRMNLKTNGKTGEQIFYEGSIPTTFFAKRFTNGTVLPAWFFPLSVSVLPPATEKLTAAYVRDLFKYIKGDTDDFHAWMQKNGFRKRHGKKGRQRKSYQQHYNFLFANPRPSGGCALFGIQIEGINRLNFFEDSEEKAWKITPLGIRHHYREFAIERGGAELDLTDISIAVIGCGAVGSRVAEKLVQMGIGRIVLVDFDIMSHNNVFRHYLGSSAIGLYKAKAIADKLSSEFMGVTAIPYCVDRARWIEECLAESSDVDFIIDATGDFTGMRDFNKKSSQIAAPPTIYTWVEACGVGGHAILSGNTPGCLECLIYDRPQGPYMSCHYLEPDQVVVKDLLGCGGFIPFSAMDADKTAIMVCEMIRDAILHPEEVPSMYRSWRGRPEEAQKNGFRFNPIFEATPPLSFRSFLDFNRPACPVCGERK